MPSDLQFVARMQGRTIACALALLGLGSCSLLFSAPDGEARGDAGSAADADPVRPDADPLGPDADPLSPDAALGPCDDSTTLRIFHLDGDLANLCDAPDALTPSESCGTGDCFQQTVMGVGLRFGTLSPFRYFTLLHSPDLEKDTLEISMKVRATSEVARVAIFSKDASGSEEGHMGLYQVRHATNAALRYFVVKFQDAINEEFVCSQPVPHGSAEYAVVVTVGPEGASITVDGQNGGEDDLIKYGDPPNDTAVRCTLASERQVTPTMKDNTEDLVFGVTNETWGTPVADRPYLNGLMDEIVIRGWDQL